MIVIVGATGFTGQQVARQLIARGCKVRLTGRNKAKLEKLIGSLGGSFDCVPIDVTEPASVSAALEPATTVVNCAGPFAEIGEPVVRECVRIGAHYIDTTGEQEFIRRVYERYGQEARSKHAALIPACAVEYALADAAAAALAEQLRPLNSVEVVYCVHDLRTSKGTKKSALGAIAAPGFWLENGVLTEVHPASRPRRFSIPGEKGKLAYAFPGGEVFMLPLHLRPATISTYIVLPMPPFIASLITTSARLVLRSPLRRLVTALIDSLPGPGSPEEIESGKFAVLCIGANDSGSGAVLVSASDPYRLTAILAAGVAAHVEVNAPAMFGPLAPSMVAGYRLIQALTEPAGASWQMQH
ncbi:MAG TPA: SDR family NAD(P)-dependent oxidoreductase [Candidatus Obscuribacterales bacterium]